jgi:hypothetical protein
MFLSLPSDVIWLIFKSYLKDVNNGLFRLKNTIHTSSFAREKSQNEVQKTYDGNENYLHSVVMHHFIDFVYPLALVCKKFAHILKKKIVPKIPDDDHQGMSCIKVNP